MGEGSKTRTTLGELHCDMTGACPLLGFAALNRNLQGLSVFRGRLVGAERSEAQQRSVENQRTAPLDYRSCTDTGRLNR